MSQRTKLFESFTKVEEGVQVSRGGGQHDCGHRVTWAARPVRRLETSSVSSVAYQNDETARSVSFDLVFEFVFGPQQTSVLYR